MTREDLFRAVGEVREDQIEAAETIKKQVRPWRRLGALAACLALVVTVTGVTAAKWEEADLWKAIVKSFNPAVEAGEDPDSWKPLVVPFNPGADSGAGEAEDRDGSEYWTEEGVQPVSYSVGVEIAEVQWTGAVACPKTGEEVSPSPGLQRLPPETPEELLGEDTMIFRGTVRELRRAQIMSGDYKADYTVASVEVTDCIRGDLTEGKMYHILYTGSPGHMPAISENLGYLELGSDAIFMPRWTNPEAGWVTEDGFFAYIDLAEMYFEEGLRFLFLDTGEGLAFERSVYTDLGPAETLDEVAAYIRKQIGEEEFPRQVIVGEEEETEAGGYVFVEGTEQTQPAAEPAAPETEPSKGTNAPAGAREVPPDTPDSGSKPGVSP